MYTHWFGYNVYIRITDNQFPYTFIYVCKLSLNNCFTISESCEF